MLTEESSMDDTIKVGRWCKVLICIVILAISSLFIFHNASIAGVTSCQNLPVRIAGTTPAYFSTLQAAYNAAVDGDIIQGLAVTFTENVTLDGNISVTFDGGYDCGYSLHSGMSAVKGKITDNAGRLTIGNFTIVSSSPDSTYVIASSAGPGGAISPLGTLSVASGATATFNIAPNAGYRVSDVLVDGISQGSITSYTFTNVTTNHTISASFAISTYTITVSAGANGTISPSGVVSVNSGGTGIFTITPNTGYHVSDVTVDGVSQGAITSYTFTNVVASHTIAATFATSNTYTITASAGSGGSISPSGTVAVNYGGSQTFTITPNNRYTIAGITIDGVSQGAQTSITFVNVTANHTIAATFATNSRAVTISIDSPSKTATINKPDVMVTGTITNAGGYETGVTVNGVVANIYGNQFVANHVPLVAGTNTITAIAADINGAQSSDTLSVDALISGYYIALRGTTESSIAPLITTLQIDGPFSIATSTITVNGPGQPTFLSSSPDTYQVQMAPEGIYYFTASVTGPDGHPYQDTIGVAAMNAAAIDTLLRGKWNAMVSSLSNKDIPTALKYISPTTRSIYQQMYTAIKDQLPAMVATQTGLNFISINNNTAFYDLVTSENGVSAKYEVIFVKDTNGQWIIQDF